MLHLFQNNRGFIFALQTTLYSFKGYLFFAIPASGIPSSGIPFFDISISDISESAISVFAIPISGTATF